MKHYLNAEALIEAICCLVFGVTLFCITYSGKYLLFVTPRAKPYLYFAAAVMVLWAAMCLTRIGRAKYKLRPKRFLVLILPMMAMTLPYQPLRADSTQAEYSNIDPGGAASSDSADTASTVPEKTASPSPEGSAFSAPDTKSSTGNSAPYTSPVHKERTLPPGIDKEKKRIVVSDEDFYPWIAELNYHPDSYEGYEIVIHGSVYSGSPRMQEGEFAVTRLVMTCCAADLAPVGPLCVGYQGETPGMDSWITVTGTFHYDRMRGTMIQVQSLEDAEPAEKEYVYPTMY